MYNDGNPFVSICMITYNHEEFLKNAILSVLDQNFDFEFELIISDDFSTDNSDIIIKDIIKNHPKSKVIRYFRQTMNLGVRGNFNFSLNKCLGKYIALCEGDDFWIDNEKLKKQFNIMENNPQFSLVYTGAKIVDQKSQIIQSGNFFFDKKNLSKIDVYSFNFNIPTASVMFRNCFNFNLPDLLNLDTILYTKLIEIGDFKYLDNEMVVYRIHDGGVWSSMQEQKKVYSIFLTQSYLLNLIPFKFKKHSYISYLKTLKKLMFFKNDIVFKVKFQFLYFFIRIKIFRLRWFQ